MIFDINIELKLLESQPEWVGIQERIVSLNDNLQRQVIAFDKSPDKFNQKRIEKAESEIKFFENILLFWASNYQKMKNLSQAVDHQVEASNNGAKLLELIDDLRIAHKFEYEENIILSETFIKLAEKKEIDTTNLKQSFSKLHSKIKEYWIHMNKRINEITNESN